jgi:hypothetical protein
MAKTWILRTETKGTGAQMVPLEERPNRSEPVEPVFVPGPPRPSAEPAEPEKQVPRRFRMMDVMTRELLVEDGSLREVVDALQGVRSVVDVQVYVWQPEHDRWRRLTFDEERAILDLARESQGQSHQA